MHLLLLSRSTALYSTQSLLRAARRRGHEAEAVDYARVNSVQRDGRVTLTFEGEPLAGVDAVLGRVSPLYTPLAAAVIAQFTAAGALAFPSTEGLLLARNKWRALTALLAAGVPAPASAMLNDPDDLDAVAASLGGYPLLLKLLESTHGAGVVRVQDALGARSTLDAFASLHQGVLVQEYIPETGGADVRVIVVGGAVVAAMRRVPAVGEFRSNLHRGGRAEPVELSAAEVDVALRAARTVGLDIAGVDLLRARRGPLVLEVNASPGLEGIEAASEVDVAGAIIDFIAERVAAASGKA